MRLVLPLVALLLPLALAPAAEADHVGPCGHQYVEAVLWFALDHRSPKRLANDVGNCVRNTPGDLCDTGLPCVLP